MAQIDRFTQRARRVLSYASQEAARCRSSQILTEHLLIGLIEVPGSVSAKALRELAVDADRVRELSRSLPEASQSKEEYRLRIELSQEVQEVLAEAIVNANNDKHAWVSTELLLRSLLSHSSARAVQILKMLGVGAEQVIEQLRASETEDTVAHSAPPPAEMSAVGAIGRVGRRRNEKKESPLMDQLALDLTAKAAAGKMDPVIGRAKEIERVIQILARRTKNNPALIGDPGVGKTAIVEGLAQAIVAGNVPAQLLNKRVLQLDMGSLVAGTMYRGQFEERMMRIIQELKGSNAILFIDEIHTLVGAGGGNSSLDAANILKPALSRGEMQVIGATTVEEYRRNIEKDAALERRFQSVVVDEPDEEDSIQILKGIRDRYENHHHLVITDEAVEAAVHLSKRYITERFLPDKAIDLIDEAGSRVKMYKNPAVDSANELIARLRDVRKESLLAAEQNDEARVKSLQENQQFLEKEVDRIYNQWDRETAPRVSAEDVAEIVTMWTGIPVISMTDDESARLLRMEEELGKSIIGQKEAIDIISRAIRRSRSGLKDPKRPVGSFLFLGPTGVGKTELTKSLAKFLFGSEDALIQLDMSEFMERHNTSRLTGSPPGYVGSEDPGQLTEAVRRNPYSLVVFDEIDKANPEVMNMLLQIMEEGHLSDAKGKKVDFRNTIIIMTSNIGADVIKRQNSFGFTLVGSEENGESKDHEEMKKKLEEKLKKALRPEFLNRLDNIVTFRMLNLDDMQQIIELEIEKVNERLSEQDIRVSLTETALEKLTRDGFDPEMGARPMRRVIQQQVEDPLADAILSHEFIAGDRVTISLDDNNELKMSRGRRRPVRRKKLALGA